MTERKLRRVQTLAPFGVGAVFDVVGESFVAEDISRWYGFPHKVRAPRIAPLFGVKEIRTAPPAPRSGKLEDGPGVPFFRFPQWLFCPGCRRMTRWKYTLEQPGQAPRCDKCKTSRQLVPMRFVMICGNGHLDDVDWFRWTHSEAKTRDQKQCQKPDLRFNVRKGVGGGLQSLETRCAVCNAARTLKGIASPKAPKQLRLTCRGRQPWLPAAVSEHCDATPAIVQRGASNVHFPLVGSAIDIPPESDYDHYGLAASKIRNDPNFKLIEELPNHPMRAGLVNLIALEVGVTAEAVEQALAEQLGGGTASAGIEESEEQVRRDEFTAFTTVRDKKPHPDDNFVTEHADLSARTRPGAKGPAADSLACDIEHLVLAHRLREIRVLRGFTRYTMQRTVKPDLGQNLDWLPGIEVFGEGVFFSLQNERLAAWEKRQDVLERTAPLGVRLKHSIWSRFLPEATPRFIVLHTLAHILIRQLIYETGYSSSSLRERLYVSAPGSGHSMAGVLIYTGAGDAEGTLGGLVRSGDPDWFVPTVLTALQTAAWCSLDPVCRESPGQGPDSLSLAGCHACALVAETSCDHANSLLDRRLLIDPAFGFFADALALGTKQAAEKVF